MNKIRSDDEKAAVSVAEKKTEIKSLTSPMSRPPKEQDFYPDNTMLYIPHLLNIFSMVVMKVTIMLVKGQFDSRTLLHKTLSMQYQTEQ